MSDIKPGDRVTLRPKTCRCGARLRWDAKVGLCWDCHVQARQAVAAARSEERVIRRAWIGIRARCTNPQHKAYRSYGGRGITICDQWKDDCPAFAEHIGPRPSPKHEVDRIDNDRGYEPGNVHWATRSENDRNRRSTTWVEFRGERRRLIDLCEESPVSVGTAANRIQHLGWSVEDAVTTPPRKMLPKGQGDRYLRNLGIVDEGVPS